MLMVDYERGKVMVWTSVKESLPKKKKLVLVRNIKRNELMLARLIIEKCLISPIEKYHHWVFESGLFHRNLSLEDEWQ